MPHTPADLPGTDPRFHESRNYLTPVIYRGEKILASHGSCKENGCNYSSAWTSNGARDRGMWTHRAGKVLDARFTYFRETLKKSAAETAELIDATSDKHTVPFDKWMRIVNRHVRALAGVETDDLPDAAYRVKYDLGVGAQDMAEHVLDQAYEF